MNPRTRAALIARDPDAGVPLPGRIVLSLALGLALAGCGGEPAPPAEVVRGVQILEIGLAGASTAREFPAVVEAANRVELAFEVPGQVVQLPVTEGQFVKSGQLLAALDMRELEAARDADRARRAEARANFERYQELYAANAVSLQDLEIEQRQFEVNDARLRASQKALDDATLRAPFAGRVARLSIDLYENVRAKDPVLVLQDETSLEARIDLPEGNVLGMPRGVTVEQVNQAIEAEVSIPAQSDRRYPARVSELSTVVDRVTGTFSMTLAFDPPQDRGVVPGTTARVHLRRTATAAALQVPQLIPATAVASDASGGWVVWKVDPSTMTVRSSAVEIGTLGDTTVEVRSGLSDGDLVVTSGVSHLREGMQVKRYEPKS